MEQSQVRAALHQRLVESGEKERMKEFLRTRLAETGWRDDLKKHIQDVISSKGLDQITVDGLVDEVTPYGRKTVPDSIRTEMLRRIRLFLEKNE